MMRVGFCRMAGHGRIGADPAHARGKRLRSHRSGLLLDARAPAPRVPAIGKSGAAAARMQVDVTRALVGPRRHHHLPGAATGPSRCTPSCASAGWNGYWIDAASDAAHGRRRGASCLDPVNRNVIDAAPGDGGVRNYIGGNCTVSLMLMALAGPVPAPDLVEWMTRDDLPGGVRAPARRTCASSLQQMGEAHPAAKDLLDDPASSILDIDREVADILRDDARSRPNTSASARGQPAALDRRGPAATARARKSGRRRPKRNKILGRAG